jgi:hypothetical protein
MVLIVASTDKHGLGDLPVSATRKMREFAFRIRSQPVGSTNPLFHPVAITEQMASMT